MVNVDLDPALSLLSRLLMILEYWMALVCNHLPPLSIGVGCMLALLVNACSYFLVFFKFMEEDDLRK